MFSFLKDFWHSILYKVFGSKKVNSLPPVPNTVVVKLPEDIVSPPLLFSDEENIFIEKAIKTFEDVKVKRNQYTDPEVLSKLADKYIYNNLMSDYELANRPKKVDTVFLISSHNFTVDGIDHTFSVFPFIDKKLKRYNIHSTLLNGYIRVNVSDISSFLNKMIEAKNNPAMKLHQQGIYR